MSTNLVLAAAVIRTRAIAAVWAHHASAYPGARRPHLHAAAVLQ